MEASWDIVFVRHAQARHNADAVVRGTRAYLDPVNTDAELTEFGEKQARDSREILGLPGEYDTIFCSPLRRCRQTLLSMMPSAVDAAVILDDQLMEPQGEAVCNRRIERGSLDMLTPLAWCLSSVAAANPFNHVQEGHHGEGRYGVFVDRVRRFTEEVLMPMRGRRILIVGHHDWIRVWLNEFKGPGAARSLANCEVLHVR